MIVRAEPKSIAPPLPRRREDRTGVLGPYELRGPSPAEQSVTQVSWLHTPNGVRKRHRPLPRRMKKGAEGGASSAPFSLGRANWVWAGWMASPGLGDDLRGLSKAGEGDRGQNGGGGEYVIELGHGSDFRVGEAGEA